LQELYTIHRIPADIAEQREIVGPDDLASGLDALTSLAFGEDHVE
jgi:hypothetical protein